MIVPLLSAPIRILCLIICLCGVLQAQTDLYWDRPEIPFNAGGAPVAVNSKGDIFIGTGSTLARSTDGGTTWEHVLLGPSVTDIMAVDFTSDDDIYVCTISSGLFRSADNGRTWRRIENWPQIAMFPLSLVINTDDKIYVGTIHGNLYRSTDEGMSWEVVQTMESTIEAVTDNQGNIYAAAPGGEERKFYFSSDDGRTWSERTDPLPDSLNSIAISPTGTLFACARGLYSSSDAGESWNLLGLADMQVADVVVHPGGSIIALTKNQGLYRSTDGGASWLPPSGNIPGEIFDTFLWLVPPMLAVTPAGDIFCGTSSEGLIRSTDGGITWNMVNTNLGTYQISGIEWDGANRILYARVNRYLQTTYTSSSAMFRSTDLGMKWEPIFPEFATGMVIENNGELFISVAENIHRSTDHGDSWSVVSGSLPQKQGQYVHIARPAPGVIIAVFEDGEVYRSANRGESWNLQGNNGPGMLLVANGRGTIVAYDGMRSTDEGATWSTGTGFPGNFAPVTVAPNGDFYARSSSNIYRSTDDGASWAAYPSHMPTLPSLQPAAPQGLGIATDGRLIMAAEPGNLYIYTESTDSWATYGAPLPIRSYVTAVTMISGGRILVGTGSGGMFVAGETSDIRSFREDAASGLRLAAPVPQPASGVTTLRFRIPEGGMVRLSLFDMMGRPVATLLDEPMAAGEGSVEFDAGDYPDGVYMCRLETDRGEVQGMMVIVGK